MPSVVVIGATSAIAGAAARRLVDGGARFLLVARNEARLKNVADDLLARGAGAVETLVLDLRDAASHAQIVESARTALGRIEVVLIAHGTLPEQSSVQDSYPATLACFEDNALSVISLCAAFGAVLSAQRGGSLVVVSSVAGDRGRASNYVYGAAKAAVSAYLQGLRNRLHRDGVHVLTVKPGIVESPMTAHLKKSALWTTPDRVARDIVRGIAAKKDVIYTPGYWRVVMLVIRCLPERVFKRLSL
jgi:short-subunit dehydrogenase